ncbi:MAG: LCP family protein [Marmoricola sp.]
MTPTGTGGGPVEPPPAEVPALPAGVSPPVLDESERARLDWEHPDYQGVRRRRRRRRRRAHWYRPRNTVVIPLVLVLAVLAGIALYLDAQLAGIRRAPLLPAFDGAGGVGTNVLLITSAATGDSLALDQRTMVVQLVHVSADRSRATVVDVPRDLLVRPSRTAPRASLPASGTVRQVYARGGDPALVTWVRSVLGIRVDHVVQVSSDAYRRVTDRLGGVTLATAAGPRRLDGGGALRYADAPGITTVEAGHRYQQWLKAMLTATVRPGVLLDPFVVVGLLRDATPRLIADDTFTTGAMRGLLWSCRHLDPGSIRYLTTPHRHYATIHGHRVLLGDRAALTQLATALRHDDASALGTFAG